MPRQLHLNLFVQSRGHHEAAWNHPDAAPDSLTDVRYYQKIAQRAEQGLFDSIFFADQLALSDDAARSVFQSELLKVANAVAAGLPLTDGKADLGRAWAILAMLVGGVTLARAVEDQALAEDIASAVREAVAPIDVGR